MANKERAIIVIDGKVVSRKFYTRMMSGFFAATYNILDVESGIKGIILCDKRQVDCVVVSNQLPDCDVLDFLSQLSERMGENREVPVVIIAEEDNEQEARLTLRLGAFDYLVKGRFSPVSLVQTVKNAMEAARLHKELAQSRQTLLDNAHKAGMAEIANGVLHNIGNNMNSVATSVDTISSTLERSRMRGLRQANKLLESFGELLDQHPKGRDLLRYYQSLEDKWDEERDFMVSEVRQLMERVTDIRNDIYEQTHYANSELYLEELDANKILRDTVRLLMPTMDEAKIELDDRCQTLPRVKSVKVKLLLVLNNLIKNSIESLAACKQEHKCITVGTYSVGDAHFCVFVSDNGQGIPALHRDKIFNYGFTTRKGLHGVGLHVAANAATELGGKLSLISASEEPGASFELVLPIKKQATMDEPIPTSHCHR